MRFAPAASSAARRPSGAVTSAWSSTRVAQSGGGGPQLGGVDGGVDEELGHAGAELADQPLEGGSSGLSAVHHEVVGRQDPLLGGQPPEREADHPLARLPEQAEREPELHREVEHHVEELGSLLEHAHVVVEVAHVEAPEDGPLHLGPELAAHLVEVGVVPQVRDGAGEPAVAVEQGGGVGDRAPAVALPLGVEREVHADVLAPVAGRRVAGPRARDHQPGARAGAVAQGLPGGLRWRRGTSRGRRSSR